MGRSSTAREAFQPGSAAAMVRIRAGEQVVTECLLAEAYQGLSGFHLVEVPSLHVLLQLVRWWRRRDLELRPVTPVRSGR